MIGGFPPALSGDVKVQIGLNRARAKDVRGRLDGVPKQASIVDLQDGDIFAPRGRD